VTGVPVSIGSQNQAGSQASLARSDHVHDASLTAVSDTIAANVVNYSPDPTVDIVRITVTGATRNVEGLVAPTAGQRTRKILDNVGGTERLVLINQDLSSATPANKFSLPRGLPIVVGPGQSVELWYDPTLTRWTVVSQSGQLYDAVSAWFREEKSFTGVSGGLAIDFKLAQKQAVTLSGNATLTLSFPGVGNYLLRVVQPSSGSTFFSATLSVGTGVVKAPGGALIYTAANNAVDIVSLYYNGLDVYAVLSANFLTVV
jgi:hypothetical protein